MAGSSINAEVAVPPPLMMMEDKIQVTMVDGDDDEGSDGGKGELLSGGCTSDDTDDLDSDSMKDHPPPPLQLQLQKNVAPEVEAPSSPSDVAAPQTDDEAEGDRSMGEAVVEDDNNNNNVDDARHHSPSAATAAAADLNNDDEAPAPAEGDPEAAAIEAASTPMEEAVDQGDGNMEQEQEMAPQLNEAASSELPAAEPVYDDDDEADQVRDETQENVSDISSSDHEDDDAGISDNWMNPNSPQDGLAGDAAPTDNFGAENLPAGDGMTRNRSFTICSVITNTSEHGSVRSARRENVDRLLMSGSGPMSDIGAMSATGRVGPPSLGGSSVAGSDISGRRGRRGLERPNFAYTYDDNYYKSGDWLRFVPRRSSADVALRSSQTSSEPHSLEEGGVPHHGTASHGFVHGGSPGYGNTTGRQMNPDTYYRGFDNTRIRMGFGAYNRYPGVSASKVPHTRMRDPMAVDAHQGGGVHHHHRHHHHHHHHHQQYQSGYQGEGGIIGPNGEVLGTPSTVDANLSLERNLGPGGFLPQYPADQYHGGHPASHMYPNLISVPIDEEEGVGAYEMAEHVSRKDGSTPPLEIHCYDDPDSFDENNVGHAYEDNNVGHAQADIGASHHSENYQAGDVQDNMEQLQDPTFTDLPEGIDVVREASPPPDTLHSSQSPNTPPPPEAGMQFESSLRVGGIVPPNSSSRSNSNQDRKSSLASRSQGNTPPLLREQKMHEASWDSKYETYACRVDQRQEDRSVEIPIFSMTRPHMRAFHFAWFTFFFAFIAWFAITPLLAEVQKSLELTKEQIWTSSICSVAGAVVTRCMAGLFCDMFGARWISAVVLFICGVPTIFTGAVNTAAGLSVLRLVTGIGGSAFVTCQYWTCTMFTKEVAGTANALAAGWGNLGGGVAQIFVGSMLFPLFKWIYSEAGTERDPADLSWRTCCIIPGLMCTAFTFVVLRYSDDSPKGNYRKRKHLGLMQKPSAMKHVKAAIHDHNTWLLLIQYGCCFGVELTTSNAAALYFKEEFELSTEAAAAVASTFGWMNLFARGLGGFLSDISNAYRGMRGRLVWQLLCFFLEGVFVMVFSKAKTLGGAITALMTFSLFVQGAEGSTFGIVPYLNPNVTGTVAGIVGAGGNAGAVIFSILFRQMDYRNAFFWMGASTSVISLLSSFVWIKGYEGLFFKRRVIPAPQHRQQQQQQESERTGVKESKPPNASELAATDDDGAQNHSRSYMGTDPHSSVSGPLSH